MDQKTTKADVQREVEAACAQYGLVKQDSKLKDTSIYMHDFPINKKTALSVEKMRIEIKLRGMVLSYKIRWLNSISQNLKTLRTDKVEFFDTSTAVQIHGKVYELVMAAKELASVYTRL